MSDRVDGSLSDHASVVRLLLAQDGIGIDAQQLEQVVEVWRFYSSLRPVLVALDGEEEQALVAAFDPSWRAS